MSHHYSGQNFGFPHGNPLLDFTDLYAFPKPGDAGTSIIIVNVHPSVSFQPPGPTTVTPSSNDALYEIKIDTDGDLIANILYSVCFAAAADGKQTATLRRVEGPAATGTGEHGRVILDDAPVSTGTEATVTDAGGYLFLPAGAAIDNLQFTGTDYFLDKNISSIALEVPNSELGSGKLGLWVRTLDGATGSWVQADRGSKPSQTPFLSGDSNSAYLAAQPSEDARFIPVFAHALEHGGGYTPQEAMIAAALLLPDIMHFETAHQAAYPANGRALTDDASGHLLAVFKNGKLTSVGVPPHNDLLAGLRYVGAPHTA
jgi:hypothetical protein